MDVSVGIVYEDGLATTDTKLRAAIEKMPSLQIISEAELYKAEPQSKAALISVQDSTFVSALARMTTLKKQWPNLRIVVAIQVIDAAKLRQLVDAGADSFITRRPSLDDLRAALMLPGDNLPRDGGASPAVATKALSFDLTHRETQILRMLSAGFSNKDVARRLALSVRTVETHRLSLRRKTQTGRLKELIALARTLRLAPIDDSKPPQKLRLGR